MGLRPDDLRSVRPFQVIVYLSYMAAGTQSALMGAPPGAVAQAMGDTIGVLWIGMLIVFPAVSLLGLGLMRRWACSMWLQLSGNLGVAGASAGYVVSVLQVTWAERASLAAWVVGSLVLCALWMVAGDVQRIVVVERRIREIGSEDD
jgi:hypothetical protein